MSLAFTKSKFYKICLKEKRRFSKTIALHKCFSCGKKLLRNYRIFCSVKCCGIFRREHKTDIRTLHIQKCRFCKKYFPTNKYSFCSTKCWYNYRIEHQLPSGSKKDYEKRSRSLSKWYANNPLLAKEKFNIEKIMEQIFLSLNFKKNADFFHNKCIRTKNTVRCPDFTFPKIKLIVECDGEFWHKCKIEKDIKRRKELRNLGYKLLHFSGRKILDGNNFNKIREMIKFECGNNKIN